MSVAVVQVLVGVPEIVGFPRLISTLECLRSDDRRGVKSLEKLAALALVKMALQDPTKRERLENIVKSSNMTDLAPLITVEDLGPFIMEHVPLQTVVPYLHEPCFMILLRPNSFSLASPDGSSIQERFTETEDLLDTSFNLFTAICKRPLSFLIVKVSIEFESPSAIAMRFCQKSIISRCNLKRRLLEESGHCWTLTLSKTEEE